MNQLSLLDLIAEAETAQPLTALPVMSPEPEPQAEIAQDPNALPSCYWCGAPMKIRAEGRQNDSIELLRLWGLSCTGKHSRGGAHQCNISLTDGNECVAAPEGKRGIYWTSFSVSQGKEHHNQALSEGEAKVLGDLLKRKWEERKRSNELETDLDAQVASGETVSDLAALQAERARLVEVLRQVLTKTDLTLSDEAPIVGPTAYDLLPTIYEAVPEGPCLYRGCKGIYQPGGQRGRSACSTDARHQAWQHQQPGYMAYISYHGYTYIRVADWLSGLAPQLGVETPPAKPGDDDELAFLKDAPAPPEALAAPAEAELEPAPVPKPDERPKPTPEQLEAWLARFPAEKPSALNVLYDLPQGPPSCWARIPQPDSPGFKALPECPMCQVEPDGETEWRQLELAGGRMWQDAPRSWRCTAEGRHHLWLNLDGSACCSSWGLIPVPAWAVPASWTACGCPQLEPEALAAAEAEKKAEKKAKTSAAKKSKAKKQEAVEAA